MDPVNPAEITVQVDTMVYGGDAMGRLPDGRAVFVPYSLPGETVRVRLIQEKRGHAKAELLEVLEPSPDRIPPRCTPPAGCGGLHYQHIPYPLQLKIKREIVVDQLERIGRIPGFPVEAARPSPKTWNYRNNVQFHLTPEGKLGFVEPGTNRVVEAAGCPLAEDTINQIWPQLEFEPGSDIERVSLRLGSGDDILLVLEGVEANPPEFSVEDLPISAVYTGPAGSILLAGSDYLIMEALDRSFKVSAGSFFQVNTLQAEAMVNYLLEHMPLTPTTELLELYSGVGLFSAFLAPHVQRLVAVESASTATADFETNLDEYDNVELYEAPVEYALPDLPVHPSLVLADPPRSGMGRKVIEELVKMRPDEIFYISCDPATMARDARHLIEGGYALTSVVPFDMFPQTYHVETVVLMSRV